MPTPPMKTTDRNDTGYRIKYVGKRDEAGKPYIVRIVDGDEDAATFLTPDASQAIRNHSPTGFEWGYHGSGAAQLALALLLDATDKYKMKKVILPLYQQFKLEFVSQFPDSGWAITDHTIRQWIVGKLNRDS